MPNGPYNRFFHIFGAYAEPDEMVDLFCRYGNSFFL
jgi:hypothetical protein